MKVELIEHPTDRDWYEVKRRALITVGKTKFKEPDEKWKKDIIQAMHSPIRYIRFSFLMELPYWVSTHYARHIHAQPYIKSQRNDRQDQYDRNLAAQSEPVVMIYDLNGEEIINVLRKRLCRSASDETRMVALEMRRLVMEKCPEYEDVLKPPCEIYGKCFEIYKCRKDIN